MKLKGYVGISFGEVRSTADHRKCHLISWKQICMPKEDGGLGFTSLRDDLWREPSNIDSSRVELSTNLSWVPPTAGFVKVNVDGAHNRYTGISVCGGVIRDSNGCFIKGYVCNLGPCSSLKAKMLALLHGLQVASSLSFRKVIFETDSSQIVDSVSSGITPSLFSSNLF